MTAQLYQGEWQSKGDVADVRTCAVQLLPQTHIAVLLNAHAHFAIAAMEDLAWRHCRSGLH